MSLTCGTNIRDIVEREIKGKVARIGGSVNQLVDYSSGIQVTDINILDGGFGSIKGVAAASNLGEIRKIYLRRIKQEVKHIFRGNSVPIDRKTIELDIHNAVNYINLKERFDCSISSNVIEHSPNVIFMLLNFHMITKKNGWMFHALPNYKHTYDRFRRPTTIEHFLNDFESYQSYSDMTHVSDYIESAIVKDGWQRKFHENFPLTYPFIHFHVFDEINVQELFALVFEDVTTDLLLTERFSDNVVVCRNKINDHFISRYSDLINQVSNGRYLELMTENAVTRSPI